MKRILHVISTLEQGGTESVVLNYFNNMDKTQIMFDFLVIWGSKKGYYEDKLRAEGCNIFKLQNPPNSFYAHGKELQVFFKNHKYDIIHIHAMSALRYRVARMAKKCGIKTVIYHSHNSNNGHLLFHKLLKPQLNKWCDYKFACSELAGKFMYNGEFKIINNAINIEHFDFSYEIRDDLKKKYKLENKFVIGNIGRLTSVKNQQFLIKLIPYLRNIEQNIVLMIVGDGDMRNYLWDTVKENGLIENVIFTGNVGPEVYKYYSLFDCLAFPSKFEGLSVVLMEAQASGLSIVASDAITNENRIEENFIFLPITESEENFKNWANTILSLKSIRTQNKSILGNRGFDIKLEAKKLQEFYLTL